jgi:hypothetical protein
LLELTDQFKKLKRNFLDGYKDRRSNSCCAVKETQQFPDCAEVSTKADISMEIQQIGFLDYVSLDNTGGKPIWNFKWPLIKFNGFRIWILPIVLDVFLLRGKNGLKMNLFNERINPVRF